MMPLAIDITKQSIASARAVSQTSTCVMTEKSLFLLK
jgi:hypothetical protein